MDAAPLLQLMTEQVARDRERLLSEARQQAEALEQDARDRAGQRSQAALAAVDAELADAARRAKERAEAAAQMVLLTTKDTIADELLGGVESELARIAAGEEFPRIVESLLAELMARAPKDTPLTVLAPPAHAAACRAWLDANGHGGAAVTLDANLHDGVALQDPARSFRVTNTLGMRFAKREAALRKQCLHALFGE